MNGTVEGLPPDLAALLRDQSVLVPQDAAVFELVAKWADAPTDTASEMGVEDWRQAWVVTCRRMLAFEAALGTCEYALMTGRDEDVADALAAIAEARR